MCCDDRRQSRSTSCVRSKDAKRATQLSDCRGHLAAHRRSSTPLIAMAFFRTVSHSDLLPAIAGEGIVLRSPQMSDCAEWVQLRETSRDFLTPWEPTWPADDLTRASFRRRIKRCC